MAGNNNTARIIAGILGLIFLLLILAFVTMALVQRDEVRINAIGPFGPAPGAERGGVRFAGAIHVWEVNGHVAIDAARNATVSAHLRGPNGQPPGAGLDLTAAFERPDSDAGAIPARLRRSGPGVYTGAAALPADGQWRLRLKVPEVTGVMVFTVDP